MAGHQGRCEWFLPIGLNLIAQVSADSIPAVGSEVGNPIDRESIRTAFPAQEIARLVPVEPFASVGDEAGLVEPAGRQIPERSQFGAASE